MSTFAKVWPKCFMTTLAIVEFLAALVLVAAGLGNAAAGFWVTNVFAGFWCGALVLVHALSLFATVCCCKNKSAATRSMVIAVISLLSCAAAISFSVAFVILPNTCLLTPSCATNANSTSIFTYSLQTNFFVTFNTLGPFSTYSATQAKALFEYIQIGVAGLCFILHILFLILYYYYKNKINNEQVAPLNSQRDDYHYPQQQQQQQQQFQYQPSNRRQPGYGERPRDRR